MDENKFVNIYEKLVNSLPFYRDNLPTEWTTRNVSQYLSKKITNPQETLNVITSINRIIIGNPSKAGIPEDYRLEIAFDINTSHKSKDQRFGGDHVNHFLDEVKDIQERLLEEIEHGLL